MRYAAYIIAGLLAGWALASLIAWWAFTQPLDYADECATPDGAHYFERECDRLEGDA